MPTLSHFALERYSVEQCSGIILFYVGTGTVLVLRVVMKLGGETGEKGTRINNYIQASNGSWRYC